MQQVAFCDTQHWDSTSISSIFCHTQRVNTHLAVYFTGCCWFIKETGQETARGCRFFSQAEPTGMQRALVNEVVSCVLMQASVPYCLLYSMNKISQGDCRRESLSVTAVSRWHPWEATLVLQGILTKLCNLLLRAIFRSRSLADFKAG